MRKYGSNEGRIVVDTEGDPETIRTIASRPLDDYDVLEIEREDGPPVLDPEE
jgi:hypothetical protein